MIVLDASAAVEWVLNTELGVEVAERISSPDESLHAPHLLGVEVAQALRRLTRAGAMSPDRGRKALGDLEALDVLRYDHELLLDRVWALRENLTAYDAVYVALAEALGATLVTCDRRLAAAPGGDAQIALVGSRP